MPKGKVVIGGKKMLVDLPLMASNVPLECWFIGPKGVAKETITNRDLATSLCLTHLVNRIERVEFHLKEGPK